MKATVYSQASIIPTPRMYNATSFVLVTEEGYGIDIRINVMLENSVFIEIDTDWGERRKKEIDFIELFSIRTNVSSLLETTIRDMLKSMDIEWRKNGY